MIVEEMRASRNNAVVAFTKFTLYKDMYSTHLFCFYEGEDIKYYESRIDRYCGIPYDKMIVFNCGGKAGVKKIHSKIMANTSYSAVNTVYFIDRDYFPSEFTSYNMFETPYYSIENFYTSTSVFEKILKREFGMNIIDPDYIKCKNAYMARFNEFHECVLELNAWLKCQRKRDIENGNRSVQINMKISKYFERLDLEEVKLKHPINKLFLEGLYPEAPIITDEELAISIEELKCVNQQQFFRGKFELEFMTKMVMDLRSRAKKGDYLEENHDCIKIDVNGNPLTILSRDADTPEKLVKFLLKYKDTVGNRYKVS